MLGSVMLFLTFILVYVNLSFTENTYDEQESYSTNNFSEKLPIEVDSEFLDLQEQEKDSLITVVAILNTKVCPSCVTNAIEFINEASQKKEFTDKHNILFIDEEKEKVDRFVEVTRLNHPIKVLSSSQLDPFYHDKSKVFIFLNSESEVFHYFPIPVAHASLEAINNEIDNVIKLKNSTYNLKQTKKK